MALVDPRVFRVIVTGSRDWQDWRVVWDALTDLRLQKPLVVVHGGCPTGADRFADDWCKQTWTVKQVIKADWSLGRRAGPIRNREMVDLGADICLAFIRNGSRGASGTARLAEAAGIKTVRYTE